MIYTESQRREAVRRDMQRIVDYLDRRRTPDGRPREHTARDVASGLQMSEDHARGLLRALVTDGRIQSQHIDKQTRGYLAW